MYDYHFHKNTFSMIVLSNKPRAWYFPIKRLPNKTADASRPCAHCLRLHMNINTTRARVSDAFRVCVPIQVSLHHPSLADATTLACPTATASSSFVWRVVILHNSDDEATTAADWPQPFDIARARELSTQRIHHCRRRRHRFGRIERTHIWSGVN